MDFTLPNKVTLSRLILITPILAFLYVGSLWSELTAAVIFIIAAITDYYDGFFARKLNLGTNFGKIFDHSADKGLVTSVLIMLLYLKRIDPFLLTILVVRDILVNGIRISAASDLNVIGAGKSGKWKTALQMSAIPLLFVNPDSLNFKIYDWLHLAAYYVLWLSVVFSIVSGLEYYKLWSKNKTNH